MDARAYKMSKARDNVINPDEVVQEYGADSLRLYEMFMGPLLFFSSRRRHTISLRDCSSDVCSSDLRRVTEERSLQISAILGEGVVHQFVGNRRGSEERRVGKECRSGWWPDH